MKETISVCIVEDNAELRDALEEIINMSKECVCVGNFSSAEVALRKIPKINPDVVMMDINLGGGKNGIDCVRELKPKMPRTNFMMCTVYDESEKIFEALSVGASGYVLKKTTPKQMREAIRELYHGGSPMSSLIARKVVAAFKTRPLSTFNAGLSDIESLTYREKEILDFLSQGLMYKEIAGKMDISAETIRKHTYNIYEKLHVSNRVQAVNKLLGR